MSTLQLPPELWHHIFDLVCMDGGQTGCALSLVSRYIRECSNPFKLRSVALHGIHQISAFAALLSEAPAALNRVQHLFICDIQSTKPARLPVEEHKLQMADAFHAILSYNSATLRTLAIEVINANLGSFLGTVRITPVALPALAELSLTYNSPYEENPLRHFVNSLLVHACPTLRCLDISGLVANHDNAALRLCTRLGEIAPRLTHLRIPPRMALEVVDVMHPREEAVNRVSQGQCLLSSIRRVLVPLREEDIPSWNPHAIRGGITLVSHDCRCFRCEIVFIGAADDRIVVLEGNYTWKRPEVAWLERVGGGEGCWDERGKVARCWPW